MVVCGSDNDGRAYRQRRRLWERYYQARGFISHRALTWAARNAHKGKRPPNHAERGKG